MKNNTVVAALRLAIKIVGGEKPGAQREFAEAIGVSPQFVTAMLKGKAVPPKRAVLIEQATGGEVPRQWLRLDWETIWPAITPPEEAKG